MSRIGILGAGTFGVALARMLCRNGHDVTLWSAVASEIEHLRRTHAHPHLPEAVIPEAIRLTTDDATVCQEQDILLFAVSSPYVRSTAARMRPHIPDGQIIVDVAKGMEADTLLTMSQVISKEIRQDGRHPHLHLVALSGPTHAEEVARDLPTTIVSACDDLTVAQQVQEIFSNTCMRVYTNEDMHGVELCGAMKNIIALAAGISAGLGYGDNAKAALITRGMAEITRLGTAMGCAESTFRGLAGIGDLIVTATSVHSRNNRAGTLIGQGYTPAQATQEVGMVVEGIHALPAAIKLAQQYGVDMPLISAVDRVVNQGADPAATVHQLMSRQRTSENEPAPAGLQYERSLLDSKKGHGMKRVITYGSFDLLHYGHIDLLRRAKAMGDYLVVALSTDAYHQQKEGRPSHIPYAQRKALLESIRYVDLVIPEQGEDQKPQDFREHRIHALVMGDDRTGQFDHLQQYGVEVVYLPPAPAIATTPVKNNQNSEG
ncbi:MAG: NAD(P)H-dependent glycerol-3-phosphate dehydrogenase [Ruminococcaceae bacterium]|nr:NAD(P)H-dependent glycerol-3-phosphate dehydrogenase [Oscillospiraceae bacterium]